MTGRKYQTTAEIKTKSIKNKYWVNYRNKMMIATVEDEITLKLITNTTDDKFSDFANCRDKDGWRWKHVLIDDVTFYEI